MPAYDAAQAGGRGRRARRLLMCAVASGSWGFPRRWRPSLGGYVTIRSSTAGGTGARRALVLPSLPQPKNPEWLSQRRQDARAGECGQTSFGILSFRTWRLCDSARAISELRKFSHAAQIFNYSGTKVREKTTLFFRTSCSFVRSLEKTSWRVLERSDRPDSVIPAKAGIQANSVGRQQTWIPAFAGMTIRKRAAVAGGSFVFILSRCAPAHETLL
jgi:hypothetical protein